MAAKQIRDDDFLADVGPCLRDGAPEGLKQTVRQLSYAVWVHARTDISLRILDAAFRSDPPALVDKAFHILALEIQDAAVSKLDALFDRKNHLVCFPKIIASIRLNRCWIAQSDQIIDTLLGQADEQLTSPEIVRCRRAVGRWRNDEAGHIAWSSDNFLETIYVEASRLNDASFDILRALALLLFRFDLDDTIAYRDSLAFAFRDQMLLGRSTLSL